MPRFYAAPITERNHDFIATVEGLDAATPEAAEAARAALEDQPLVVVRDSVLEPASLVAFGRRLGELERYDEPDPGYEEFPEIAMYSNRTSRGRVPKPYWHSDGLFRDRPPDATVFHAVEAPERGGETLFRDARELYEELDAEDRRTLDGLTCVLSGGARRPLVVEHPPSGRRALRVNLGAIVGIVGVERESARRLVGELIAMHERPAGVYAHRYLPGDIVIWDNRAVAHSATQPPPPDQRRLIMRLDVRALSGSSGVSGAQRD